MCDHAKSLRAYANFGATRPHPLLMKRLQRASSIIGTLASDY